MNILVIGAGGAGGIHTRELHGRGYNVAVWDVDRAKAQSLAQSVGVKVATSDLQPCDFVVVAVPANRHYEVVQKQLNAGRKVVCEKPFCNSPEDAADLATSDPTRLFIAESQCYSGADGLGLLQKKRTLAEFGAPILWRVCAMTGYRPQAWCDTLEIGGGAFLEGGVHVLTTARVLFGEAVRWQGSVRCYSGGNGPDTGTFIIDYEYGDQLLLNIGWGTEGCFTGECQPLPNSFGLIGPKRCEAWWPGDDHHAMWEHLLKCLQNDSVQPVATIANAAGAVADCWKCYEAAKLE